ncbi:LysR family transcriptional regulator [Mycolicibacterium confluentis]|nr:LysR family transcriptional regulator [Mycolicibacterium confluentis]MCV7321920.1 LysR family transcriptional regulator [Mycolicibacterium confluentis]ORV32170.1 LysR family transcriptional regulator [Mycolicibacterium confluentis]
MDPRRLRLLLALSRLGSMRAVADSEGMSTSTVSQQIAALAAEAGTALIEPEGRRVRLTPAGRRLAGHAVGILAALDAAHATSASVTQRWWSDDLDPRADPVGVVRVGGFATGIRVSLLPVLADIADTNPGVQATISEFEPLEAFRLLVDDDLDLALAYDYNLAPASADPVLEFVALWTTPWGLAVPGQAPAVVDLRAYADASWIVNSRNTADEEAVRILASLAGFQPRITHQIDSLDLVEDLVSAGYGVGLLPMHRPTQPGITVLPLPGPGVVMTAFAVTRRGRSTWPPLRLILNRLQAKASGEAPGLDLWPRSLIPAKAQM